MSGPHAIDRPDERWACPLDSDPRGSWVFNFRGGLDRAPPPPKTGVVVVRENGSIDSTISQLLRTLAPKAPKNFLSIENGQEKFAKYIANDDFSEPPQGTDSRNPIAKF